MGDAALSIRTCPSLTCWKCVARRRAILYGRREAGDIARRQLSSSLLKNLARAKEWWIQFSPDSGERIADAADGFRIKAGCFRTFILRSGFREPSLAQDPRTRPRGFEGVEPYVPEALLARRPTVDPARAAVKRVDFAGALFGSLRAPADGAARLQSAVSLVRWLPRRTRRSDLGPDRVRQEPGTSSRRRCVPEVHDQGSNMRR